MKNGFDDVSFSDGLSYMVSNDRFNVYMDAVGALKSRKTNKKKENNVGTQTSLGCYLTVCSIIG